MTSLSNEPVHITEQQILSEILLALQGEQCAFTTFSATHQGGFRLVDISRWCHLSPDIEAKLEKVVKSSNYVLAIEHWKKGQTYATGENTSRSRDGSKEPALLDSIKKAVAESIIDDYKSYLGTVDQMRLKVKKYTIEDVFMFILERSKRLCYTNSLIKKLDELSGIEMMNLLFSEWNIHCMRDWNFSFAVRTLHKGSIALQTLCTLWLLDAQLPKKTRWFIRLMNELPRLDTNKSRLSYNSLQTSFNSSFCSANDSTTTMIKEPLGGLSRQLILPAVIDKEVLPATLLGSGELVSLILDIGKTVHFLNVLRSTRFYAHRLDDRQKIIDAIPPSVWIIPTEIGKLFTAVLQLYCIVCEDMMQELIGKQRLIDHLNLVHAYFFMLRGDLWAELERTFFIITTQSSEAYTPFSSRKNLSQRSKMKIAERWMNNALASCSPPSNFADLMCLLTGEKPGKQHSHFTGKNRPKSFCESFDMHFDTKHSIGNCITDPLLLAEFFPVEVLRAYKKIFNIAANIQLQRSQLECTANNYKHIKLNSCSLFILAHLHSVRCFLSRLANHLFEDVLLMESTSIFEHIQRETNPHRLISQHGQLLDGIKKALFIYQGADTMHSALSECLRKSAKLVEAVNEFCGGMPIEESIAAMHGGEKANKVLTNRNRCIDSENYLEGKNATEKSKSLAYAIYESASAFEQSRAQLYNILKQFINGCVTKKPSFYWSRLYLLLFDTTSRI